MAIQRLNPQLRPTKVAQSSLSVPVVQHKGRMFGLIIFAVVLVAAIVLLIVFGKQFAGKAIAISPELLAAGEAGIPITSGTKMTVGEKQEVNVWAALEKGDAYGFHFKMLYDPDVLTVSVSPALKGITLLNAK